MRAGSKLCRILWAMEEAFHVTGEISSRRVRCWDSSFQSMTLAACSGEMGGRRGRSRSPAGRLLEEAEEAVRLERSDHVKRTSETNAWSAVMGR